jgi:glutamyl-tRNA synthetase
MAAMAVGRFAPSPTGPLHLGNLRTALLAWLMARSAGSDFLLRIEDLDPAASREEHMAAHEHDLRALGLDWDGSVVRQSQRGAAHDEAIAQLEGQGLLYPCYCSRREVREAAQAPHDHLPEGAYPGTCRSLTQGEQDEREAEGRAPALRLRAAAARVTFEDRLAGPTEGLVDDFVVRRRDGGAAYNLAVVVDDAAQGVEEVVRADDLLPGTPRQIHLARLLGLPEVAYAHVPLVVGPTGERLAKRDGAVTLAEREALGEGPAQVLGLLAASLGIEGAGAAPTADALVGRFDLTRVPRQPWTLSVA